MCQGKFMLLLQLIIICPLISSSGKLEFKYHTNRELGEVLSNFNKTIKNVRTFMYSIGKTKMGNNLWVLEMTASQRGKLGVPNVKLIGNMHGNEALGREVLLHFIEYLTDNYNTNAEVGWLLNNTIIHIMPTLNPDGFDEANTPIKIQRNVAYTGDKGRTNGNGLVDLNRDFPDPFFPNHVRGAAESLALRKWMSETPFILSAALHGGALVANYPFDSLKDTRWEIFIRKMKEIGDDKEEGKRIRLEYIGSTGERLSSLTPDDDVFKHLATVYSQNHKTMHLGKPCRSGEEFKGGITNGAKWYVLEGSMGDYNYATHGCMEVTLEISCLKYPMEKDLPNLWEENKLALLKYCMEANKGVTGQILDIETRKPIGGANLKILKRNVTFHSYNKTGEFWRLLLPGEYKLEVQAKGYYTEIYSFTVKDYKETFPQLTFLEILLLNVSYPTTTASTTTYKTTEWITPDTTMWTGNLQSRAGFEREDKVDSPDPSPSRQIDTRNIANVFNNVVLTYIITMWHLLVLC